MKFTFPIRKNAGGYEAELKIDGHPMRSLWKPTRSEALQAIKLEAELYGWIDGVT